MMGDGAALRLALDLLHAPWRVRLVRREPLPEGVGLLLRVAAGDASAEQHSVELADRPLEVIRQAAAFFIEQILLSPDADSYRVLGANSDVGDGELRRNMASLMTWLHPDTTREADRSLVAPRIATAWKDLKTPERRATYDRAQSLASNSGDRKKKRARDRATSVRGANGRLHSRSGKSRGAEDAFDDSIGGRLRRALFLLFGL